jgi:DNA-binding MarR family transcriptional regulator
MDELVEQTKTTNQLLRLAFGEAIERRLNSVASGGASAKVLAALRDKDDLSMEDLQKASGVPRSSLYAIVAGLERQGAIERTRRGYVAISGAAAPFLPGVKRGESQRE